MAGESPAPDFASKSILTHLKSMIYEEVTEDVTENETESS
jgi:hypothetical protein